MVLHRTCAQESSWWGLCRAVLSCRDWQQDYRRGPKSSRHMWLGWADSVQAVFPANHV